MDRDTGRSKGFGFVEMGTDAEAQAAINGMNGQALGGRSVVVNEARPREERPGGFGGGSGGGSAAVAATGGGGGYGGGGVAAAVAAVATAAVVAATAAAAVAARGGGGGYGGGGGGRSRWRRRRRPRRLLSRRVRGRGYAASRSKGGAAKAHRLFHVPALDACSLWRCLRGRPASTRSNSAFGSSRSSLRDDRPSATG